MMALKLDEKKTTDFTKEAEKLADQLQHSSITEGISQTKAKSMAFEKTVEMCRQTAKSNLVRSVLASASFNLRTVFGNSNLIPCLGAQMTRSVFSMEIFSFWKFFSIFFKLFRNECSNFVSTILYVCGRVVAKISMCF